MITAIDTNVLLDILIPGAEHSAASKALVDKHNADGRLIISEIVYAELTSQFSAGQELRAFLKDTSIRLVSSNDAALANAGNRWKQYAKTRSTRLQCPSCGTRLAVLCPECGKSVSYRQHIISDFLIGAHALVHAELLLTRDRGFYRTYFKDLRIG